MRHVHMQTELCMRGLFSLPCKHGCQSFEENFSRFATTTKGVNDPVQLLKTCCSGTFCSNICRDICCLLVGAWKGLIQGVEWVISHLPFILLHIDDTGGGDHF